MNEAVIYRSQGEHPHRSKRLVDTAIKDLDLDLSGARVLTEAGSGAFALAPIIAAAAGASEVYALARDSAYGSLEAVSAGLWELVDYLGLDRSRIQLITEKREVPDEIDIITNSGFVRPIDEELLRKGSAACAVAYMCEGWEVRPGDVDLEACREMNIPVIGVHEDFAGMGVFSSCGQLVLKLCFEAGLEVAGNKMLIISSDRFGTIAHEALHANHAEVELLESSSLITDGALRRLDSIVIADYSAEGTILGGDSGPSCQKIGELNPGLCIVQLAGSVNLSQFRENNIRVYPDIALPAHKMSVTLAHLGYRPVVYLQAQGLKSGELLWRFRRDGASFGAYSGLLYELEGHPLRGFPPEKY